VLFDKEKKNKVGSERPPTSIKEKETLWSEVPYVYPHQRKKFREQFTDFNVADRIVIDWRLWSFLF